MGKKAKAGDGQPRSNRRKKCDALTVRLLPAQKAELENKAAIVGMRVTSYARHVLLTDRPIAPSRVNQAALAELAKLIFEIRKIGVNVNQIARHCNATGQALAEEALKQFEGPLIAVASGAASLILNLSNPDEEEDAS